MKPSAAERLARRMDAWFSILLRYDLSRTDVVKWVLFARDLLVLLLLSVVTLSAASAYLSTRQADGLLRASLASEARAIGDAVARASFVPLTLEDDRALSALVGSYRNVEHLGSLRVLDARGAVRAALAASGPGSGSVTLRVPVLPISEEESVQVPGAPVGFIEVGMRRGWIGVKARGIALTNVAVAGALAICVWVFGVVIVRNLIDRMRGLIGEARLVAELKAANAELEAFSSSVAHDLRAPIRQILGYAQLFIEDYGAALDDEARRRLEKIRAGALRMGRLIDDLLNLSKVTRQTLSPGRVPLGALARETVQELQAEAAGRSVEWRVGELFDARCDPALVRQVFVNLLSNALKYTRPRARAVIEVGSITTASGERAVFVRDNGVGFDMRYAGKLFGIFQRLHAESEFEGTGVGLATVDRILRKHGGRIWADAAPEKGATFFFTLEAADAAPRSTA